MSFGDEVNRSFELGFGVNPNFKRALAFIKDRAEIVEDKSKLRARENKSAGVAKTLMKDEKRVDDQEITL